MPYDDLKNGELMKLYRETGDKEIVFVLFNRIEHHLAAKAMDILKNREDTEDILADVLLELFDDLLLRDIKDFGAYVYTKTRNKCLTFLKKMKRMDLLDLADQKYPKDLVEIMDLSSLDEKPTALKQILFDCIEEMPEKEKRCMKYFYFYERGDGRFGLSYREIEKRTGYNIREVTSALQTARRKLKKCLQTRGIDWDDISGEDL